MQIRLVCCGLILLLADAHGNTDCSLNQTVVTLRSLFMIMWLITEQMLSHGGQTNTIIFRDVSRHKTLLLVRIILCKHSLVCPLLLALAYNYCWKVIFVFPTSKPHFSSLDLHYLHSSAFSSVSTKHQSHLAVLSLWARCFTACRLLLLCVPNVSLSSCICMSFTVALFFFLCQTSSDHMSSVLVLHVLVSVRGKELCLSSSGHMHAVVYGHRLQGANDAGCASFAPYCARCIIHINCVPLTLSIENKYLFSYKSE